MSLPPLVPVSSEDDELYRLIGKRSHSIKPGLDRLRQAYQLLGMAAYPQNYLLIGGTNGKGTTAGMLWHLFALHGLRVGLYSSPHLCRLRERIQCSHGEVDNPLLVDHLKSLQQRLSSKLYEQLSFFEITTLLAFDIFHALDCQLVVLEVGLGGRWDATNVVPKAQAVAICSIDRDHEEWLGSSLGEIAQEKLGLCRPKTPLFWGERFTEGKGLTKLIADSQSQQAFPLFQAGQHFGRNDDGTFFLELAAEGGRDIFPLPAWLQSSPIILQHNFSLAFALYRWYQQHFAERLQQESGFTPLDPRQALALFGQAPYPWPSTFLGRGQRLRVAMAGGQGQDLYLDVCHNPAAVDCFVATVTRRLEAVGRRKMPGLVSVLKDKDVPAILDRLNSVLEPLILFKVQHERAFDHSSLGAAHNHRLMFDRFALAWDYAKEHWIKFAEQEWAVCGSFMAIGEVIDYFSAFPKHRRMEVQLHGTCPLAPSS